MPHPTRRKNEGKNLGRKHLELSERRRRFARKKRRWFRSGQRGSPPARNTRPPGGGLGWRSSLGTFNVRTAAVNVVNGIGHIDTLLRTCGEKARDVTGLQETQRVGTSEIVASGYHVFYSDDCSRVKSRKGQHGINLAIKEEIVINAGEDGIAIECISARLLKAQISIKSNSVTFVVTYAPTEEAPEGKKIKYMAALNCTVASIPAREYVFVSTDTNARVGKRVRAEEKQTARCWVYMAETCSTTGFRIRRQARSFEHFLFRT